jgi:hypothetical protein
MTGSSFASTAGEISLFQQPSVLGVARIGVW